jgi:hypothetical protein
LKVDPQAADRLSDDEWLAGLPLRPKLSEACRVVFDRDALLYRKLILDDPNFQQWAMDAWKAVRVDGKHSKMGHFHHVLLSFLFALKGPSKALLCHWCYGSRCETCKGRGHHLA